MEGKRDFEKSLILLILDTKRPKMESSINWLKFLEFYLFFN